VRCSAWWGLAVLVGREMKGGGLLELCILRRATSRHSMGDVKSLVFEYFHSVSRPM
jgi:hypothetical protein